MKRLGKKQKILLFPLLLFLILVGLGFQGTASNSQKVVDMAGLLDTEEEEKLQKQLSGIAEKYECDVAVVTVNSCEGKQIQDYTDDYYEANDYGYGARYDGIILLISMKERKFHMATQGWAITAFTDYGMQEIDDRISGLLSDGKYYKAFRKFGDLAEEYIVEAQKGTPFDVDHKYRKRMEIGMKLLISLLAGLAVAGCVVGGMFTQLKSVRVKHTAQEYVRSGSFHVTRQRDIFLYRTVSRIKIEKEQNSSGGGGSITHTTSGGRSSGGHTGSF